MSACIRDPGMDFKPSRLSRSTWQRMMVEQKDNEGDGAKPPAADQFRVQNVLHKIKFGIRKLKH
jgi:hypothetical protein